MESQQYNEKAYLFSAAFFFLIIIIFFISLSSKQLFDWSLYLSTQKILKEKKMKIFLIIFFFNQRILVNLELNDILYRY